MKLIAKPTHSIVILFLAKRKIKFFVVLVVISWLENDHHLILQVVIELNWI